MRQDLTATEKRNYVFLKYHKDRFFEYECNLYLLGLEKRRDHLGEQTKKSYKRTGLEKRRERTGLEKRRERTGHTSVASVPV